MLKNHCQPCGAQGVLCHATLPYGSVPPITRSRIPGQLHIMVTVISRKMYFILHNKACDSVWRTAKPCRKFPYSRHAPSCTLPDIPAERASRTSPPKSRFVEMAFQPKALNKIISQQHSKARAIMSELCQQHSQYQLKGSNSWSTYQQVPTSFHLCGIQLCFEV
jgi:hypothetical protein